ncbi:hypothetical protein BH09BAC1_BH09BAC1_28200 [soil metagenome]
MILKLISYLIEIPIETRNSDHSPKLKVTLKNGRYALGTNTVYYSHEDQYTSFKQAFEFLRPKQEEVKRVLVLGYGLGSIPHILHRQHHIKAHYTAVEIDPVVVGMAQRYGNLPEGSIVHWINADALSYVTYSKEQYDFICVDIFIDNTVPQAFLQKEFLTEAARLLKPMGKLLFSHLTTSEEQRTEVAAYFKEVFQNVFPDATYVDTTGNWVLVGEKKTIILKRKPQ